MTTDDRATIEYACKRLRYQTDVLTFIDLSMREDVSVFDKSARDGLKRILMGVIEDMDDCIEALEKIANADNDKPARPGEATPTPAPAFYYQG